MFSMAPERQVLLVDLDAFYVGVERVVEPTLRGRPVAVGGGGSGQRGVVLSASYEAREAGVRSAMPIAHARRLCPDLTLVPARFELYQRASDAVFGLLSEAVPVCQQVSVDEAYLDLSGTRRLLGPSIDVAARLQRRVRERFRLDLTIGVSANKLVSKVAAGVVKPRGLVEVAAGGEARFLAPLGVGKLPGVGPVTRGRLEELALRTAGDLQVRADEELQLAFGRMGPALRQRALGRDDTPVAAGTGRGSIGHQQVLGRGVGEYAVLEARLRELVDSAMGRLRRGALACRTVEVSLRYEDFAVRSRHHTLRHPSDIDMEIWAAAQALLRRLHQRSAAVGRIAVRLSNLAPGFQQLGLFADEQRRRQRDLLRAVDRIREVHGAGAIRFGGNGVPASRPGARGIVPRVA